LLRVALLPLDGAALFCGIPLSPGIDLRPLMQGSIYFVGNAVSLHFIIMALTGLPFGERVPFPRDSGRPSPFLGFPLFFFDSFHLRGGRPHHSSSLLCYSIFLPFVALNLPISPLELGHPGRYPITLKRQFVIFPLRGEFPISTSVPRCQTTVFSYYHHGFPHLFT